ncbi:hypothetical protein [Glycomyces sp. NPDC021274]|uniref:hypothetical protein n=1 Tax=Glycomyces sp. NPDC021274 TaxID=3155120 RepID=UPI0033CA7BEA
MPSNPEPTQPPTDEGLEELREYATSDNLDLTPETQQRAWELLLVAYNEVSRLRVELETKSVVHQCCEELVELKKDRAYLKDALADANAEVDRLRAENTAQAAQVAVARAELQRCMGRLEPYTQQLMAAGNTDAGIPIRIAVGVLRLAQDRIDEADPAALDQSGEGQA